MLSVKCFVFDVGCCVGCWMCWGWVWLGELSYACLDWVGLRYVVGLSWVELGFGC